MGYAESGGAIRDDRVYWTNLGAEMYIGVVVGTSSVKLERVKALFIQADMKPDVQENFLHSGSFRSWCM